MRSGSCCRDPCGKGARRRKGDEDHDREPDQGHARGTSSVHNAGSREDGRQMRHGIQVRRYPRTGPYRKGRSETLLQKTRGPHIQFPRHRRRAEETMQGRRGHHRRGMRRNRQKDRRDASLPERHTQKEEARNGECDQRVPSEDLHVRYHLFRRNRRLPVSVPRTQVETRRDLRSRRTGRYDHDEDHRFSRRRRGILQRGPCRQVRRHNGQITVPGLRIQSGFQRIPVDQIQEGLRSGADGFLRPRGRGSVLRNGEKSRKIRCSPHGGIR